MLTCLDDSTMTCDGRQPPKLQEWLYRGLNKVSEFDGIGVDALRPTQHGPLETSSYLSIQSATARQTQNITLVGMSGCCSKETVIKPQSISACVPSSWGTPSRWFVSFSVPQPIPKGIAIRMQIHEKASITLWPEGEGACAELPGEH